MDFYLGHCLEKGAHTLDLHWIKVSDLLDPYLEALFYTRSPAFPIKLHLAWAIGTERHQAATAFLWPLARPKRPLSLRSLELGGGLC